MNSTQSQLTEAGLLNPDQWLDEPFAREPSSFMERYGYTVYPIGPGPVDGSSNSVVIEVEPGGSTELTHIVGKISLNIRGLGQGEVVSYDPDGHRRIRTLGHEAVLLGQGATYCYHNNHRGSDPLFIVDQSTPAFEPQHEWSVEEVTPEEGLQPGNELIIWSPREPRQPDLAGVWHLTVGDHHDTTSYNRARAGITRFRGQPSHTHGRIRRVGEDGYSDVNVRLGDDTYQIDPRKSPGSPSNFGSLDVHHHSMVFRRAGTGV